MRGTQDNKLPGWVVYNRRRINKPTRHKQVKESHKKRSAFIYNLFSKQTNKYSDTPWGYYIENIAQAKLNYQLAQNAKRNSFSTRKDHLEVEKKNYEIAKFYFNEAIISSMPYPSVQEGRPEADEIINNFTYFKEVLCKLIEIESSVKYLSDQEVLQKQKEYYELFIKVAKKEAYFRAQFQSGANKHYTQLTWK